MNDISNLLLKESNDNFSNILNKKTTKIKKFKRKFKKKEKSKTIINKNNNDGIKKNKKIIKIRNPGVDLLRIISMSGIILCHILGHGGAYRRFPSYKKLNYFEGFLGWHINGFGLISGVVGYKTHKYSNLLYLWCCVFSYLVAIHFYYEKYKLIHVYENIYEEIFPVIFGKYWYFTKYFGMYLFLPAINKGIEYLTKSELKITVLSFYGIISLWQLYKNKNFDAFNIGNGGSIPWFIVLYLTGAYIGKYNVTYNGIKKFIYCLICLIVYISVSLINYQLLFNYNPYNIKRYYLRKITIFLKIFTEQRYYAVPRVLQSISLCLFLIQIKYNKYISKIICFLGPLTFGIYLIHDNNLVRRYKIQTLYNKLPNSLSFNSVIKYTFITYGKIYIICSGIDYMRHVLFTIFRIKKICIFLEKIVFKILG